MPEHNPLPWTYMNTMGLDYWEFFLQDSNDECIVNIQDKDNADFVFRACNAHYDLVAACEAVVRIIEYSQQATLANQGQAMDGYSELANFRAAAKKCQVAIDKVKSGK